MAAATILDFQKFKILTVGRLKRVDRHTDRPTDHATRSVTIGCIYVRITAIRPNNDHHRLIMHQNTNKLECGLMPEGSIKIVTKLDDMRWFSHRRRTGGRQLASERTAPEKNQLFASYRVVKQTHKLTNKQPPLKTPTSLRYATPVGNKLQIYTDRYKIYNLQYTNQKYIHKTRHDRRNRSRTCPLKRHAYHVDWYDTLTASTQLS